MTPPFDRSAQAYPRPSHRNRLLVAVAGLGVGGLVVWFRRRPFRVVVEGGSMEPVLRGGDFLLAVRGVPVRRGSLLVVEHPADPGHEMVKRAVGVPGDTVDGQRLGPGRLWVLGDDPSASTDSRAFGPVPMELVKGVVVARYWPPSAVTWFA